jgi:hypothetical protein
VEGGVARRPGIIAEAEKQAHHRGVNGGGMNVWNAGEKWIVLDCDNVLEDGADTMVKSDVLPTNA